MARVRSLVLALGLGALCGVGAAPVLASPAGPAGVSPLPAPPVAPAAASSPQAASTKATAAGAQTVVINTGPSMDQLKQETPALFQDVVGGLLAGLDQGGADFLGAAEGLNFVTRTPPALSYDHPDVRRLWGACRAAANAALLVILMAGGYNVMLRRHLALLYDGPLELLCRVLVGALLVNTSMWWAAALVDANNALCAAVGAAGLPDARRFLPLLAAGGLAWTPARLVLALVVLFFLAVCLLVVFQMLMRLVLVGVLLVVAPLGLVCWILPQTRGWSRLWASTFAGAVLVQFIQVVGMLLAVNFAAPFGAGASAGATALGPGLGLASMWLVLKLPGLVGRQIADGSGVLRGVVFGTVARAVAPAAAALGGVRRGGGRP